MSLPSDLNADVAEAVEAIEKRVPEQARRASKSLFRRISPQQYGFAAAMLAAFVGVAVLGPQVQEMRKPRRRRVVDRVRTASVRAARDAQDRAQDFRDEAGRRLQRLGGGSFRR